MGVEIRYSSLHLQTVVQRDKVKRAGFVRAHVEWSPVAWFGGTEWGLGADESLCLLQVWQCGGSVEVLPCSRIAHIERAHKPYTEDLTAHVRRNALRVAEVWMDEFKSHVYMAWNIPQEVESPHGDGFLGVWWGKKQANKKTNIRLNSSSHGSTRVLFTKLEQTLNPNPLHVEERGLMTRR